MRDAPVAPGLTVPQQRLLAKVQDVGANNSYAVVGCRERVVAERLIAKGVLVEPDHIRYAGDPLRVCLAPVKA